jgi:Tfp pilus assembly protein PilE
MAQEQQLNPLEEQTVSAENIPSSAQAQVNKISSVSALLQKSFRIYKSGFWKFIGMMLTPILGALPLVAVLLLFGLFSFLFKDGGMVLSIIKVILGLAGMAGVVVFFAVMIIAQAGLYVLVKNSSKNPTIKEAFIEAKSYAWRFFIVNIAAGIFVLLWSLLLIIPGIIAAIFYSLAVWTLFYEDYTGTSALKRSKELIKNYWWAVFGRLLFLELAIFLIIIVPGMLIDFFVGSEALKALWGFASQIISFLATPIFILYTCFIYWDLVKIKGPSNIKNKKSGGVIVVVIAVLLILVPLLSTLAVVSLNNARMKARDAKRISDIKQVQIGLEMYYGKHKKYPDNLIDLKADDFKLFNEIPVDPKEKTEYQYIKQGDNGYLLCFNLEGEAAGYEEGMNCVSNIDNN